MKFKKTKRTAMVSDIMRIHETAMDKLKATYTSPASQEALNRINRELTVELSERMSSTAGRAIMTRLGSEYRSMTIKMNTRLHEMYANELESTYLHELGHVVANMLNGRNEGHGPFWKSVMEVLGASSERCHSMDVSSLARVQKRYEYQCQKCQKVLKLTPYKHHKQQAKLLWSGRATYGCRCGGGIEYLNNG